MQLRKLIYPAFLLVCLLVFWQTRGYGFATDYLGWLNRYREGSWADVLTCFDYPGLHQFFHLINYAIYKVFGAHMWALGTLFIVAHASVCYIVYRTFRLLFYHADSDKSGLIALFTAILTALSPYCVEPMTWDACFHYFLCTALIFGSLNLLIRYYRTSKIAYLVGHLVLFILGLLTIELALVAPGLFVAYGLFYAYSRNEVKRGISLYIKLIGAYLMLIVLYFLGTKMMIGSYVGHYGADKHMNFSLSLLIATWSKYFVKLGLLTHFWEFKSKENTYFFFDTFWKAVVFIGSVFTLAFAITRKDPRAKKLLIPLLALVGFSFALLPILNLYFFYVVPFENDRYSYFAAPHFYLFITSTIFYLFDRFYWGAYLFFLGINCFFLSTTIGIARQAGNVANGLVKNFNYYEEEDLVLLCIPENLKGAYLFRDYSPNGITLNESLDWLGDRGPYNGKFTTIAHYNLTSDRDSVTAVVIDSTHIRVNIASWGTWFWRKGQGLSSFETPEFKVTTGDLYFIIEEKQKVKNRRYLYTVGNEWRSIQLPQIK